MLEVLKSNERGLADHGWLKSKHTFSFANYYNPDQMNFRALRVINEDRIAGGTGFDMHGHRDMEIISYVVKGSLRHEDSKGNKTVIRPGEVQRMSAGTGVLHSEYNEQENEETHFFQIWVMPEKTGLPFGYGQKSFEEDLNSKEMVLVISKDGRDGSISINQDADLYIARPKTGRVQEYSLKSGRNAWIQVIKGALEINGKAIGAGDALKTSETQTLLIKAQEDSEFMLFDLA